MSSANSRRKKKKQPIEYYPAIKRNGRYMIQHEWTLKHYVKWKNPDTKISAWFYLHKMAQIGKFSEMERRLVPPSRASGWGK